MRRSVGFCLLAGLIALPAAAVESQPEIRLATESGEVVGRLVALDGSGVTVETASGVETVARESAWRLAFPTDGLASLAPTATAEGVIEMVDGLLPYAAYRVEPDGVVLDSPGGGRVTLADPLEIVRRWSFDARAADRSTPLDRNGYDDRAELESTPPPEFDRLVARSRRRPEPIEAEGTIIDLEPAGVRFALPSSTADDAVVVAWERLVTLEVAAVEPPAIPRSAVRLVGRDGTTAWADRVAWRDGALVWSWGERLRGEAPAEALESIDLAAGRVTRVSDWRVVSREAVSYSAVGDATRRDPTEGGKVSFALDASLEGDRLSLRFPDPRVPDRWPRLGVTREYAAGLALDGGAAVTFALPEGATRLLGLVGLDPAAERIGSVELAVLIDDTPVWRAAFDGRTEPPGLDVRIDSQRTIARRVTFIARSTDAVRFGDRLHLADLRVIR